jgi:hypothetical protein
VYAVQYDGPAPPEDEEEEAAGNVADPKGAHDACRMSQVLGACHATM